MKHFKTFFVAICCIFMVNSVFAHRLGESALGKGFSLYGNAAEEFTYQPTISQVTGSISGSVITDVTGSTLTFQNASVAKATSVITVTYTAAGIPLVDAGGFFATDNIEAALQELGPLLAGTLFSITDGTTTETIVAGNTITFDDGTARGIDVVVVATDQINIGLDFNELTSGDVPVAADQYAYYDASGTTHLKSSVFNLNAYGATTAITAASTTLDATHNTVLADASSNAVTLNLPAAAGVAGRVYTVKAEDVSNAVTLDGDGAETIDGSATLVLGAADQFVTVQSNGTGWVVIGSGGGSAAFSSFSISDGTTTETITDGNTVTFVNAGTDGFDLTVSATDQVTFTYDLPELTNLTSGIAYDTDEFLMDDGAGGTEVTVTQRSIQEVPVRTETGATYTADATTDKVIIINAATHTLTLPDNGTARTGQIFEVKLLVAPTAVVIDPAGAVTIDGQTTYTYTAQYESLTLVFDGTNYHII